MNKLTIPSPSLYCCYATIVHALSDLLVETLVVYKRSSAELYKRVNEFIYRRHLVSHLKIVKYRFVVVLCRKAGVEKIASHAVPLHEAAIVEQFELLGDDKWHIAIG